jgi:hypothetical protein
MMRIFLLVIAMIAQAATLGQNQHLTPTSTYHGLATDGSDLGAHADFRRIEACAVHGMDSVECTGAVPVPPAFTPPAPSNLRIVKTQP